MENNILNINFINTNIPYFGSIGFYFLLFKYKNMHLFHHINVRKSFQFNKTTILSNQGNLLLSIPIKGGRNNKQHINELEVMDFSWKNKHLKSIKNCYQKAPYFDYYFNEIEALFYNSVSRKILDFNFIVFNFLMDKLTLNCNLLENKQENYPFNNYLNFSNLGNIIHYNHVYDNANLIINWDTSMLDMLFCCGNKEIHYLFRKHVELIN